MEQDGRLLAHSENTFDRLRRWSGKETAMSLGLLGLQTSPTSPADEVDPNNPEDGDWQLAELGDRES